MLYLSWVYIMLYFHKCYQTLAAAVFTKWLSKLLQNWFPESSPRTRSMDQLTDWGGQFQIFSILRDKKALMEGRIVVYSSYSS